MKKASISIALLVFTMQSLSQSLVFLGPDSTNWHHILAIDAQFHPNASPTIGAVTSNGIAFQYSNSWHYAFPNQNGCYQYPMYMDCIAYQSLLFSPILDSIILVVANTISSGEGGNFLQSYNYFTQNPVSQSLGSIPPSGMPSYSYMAGDSSAVYRLNLFLQKSTDGGITWGPDLANKNYTYRWNLAPLVKTPKLVATLINPTIPGLIVLVSSTDGAQWDTLYTLRGNYQSASVLCFGDTLFLAASASPDPSHTPYGFFKSIDAGSTWQQTLPNRNIISTSFGKSQLTIYVATPDSIFRSTDAGDSWQSIYAIPFSHITQILKHPAGDTLFLATADSGVFALTGRTVDVRKTADIISGYILEQNFPNPFNSTTEFVFTLPNAEFVRLRIFDILGREIATLVDERLPSGVYKKRWSADNLASGTYVYRLTAGSFEASRRLVLLK
jgi:hypothetical protein